MLLFNLPVIQYFIHYIVDFVFVIFQKVIIKNADSNPARELLVVKRHLKVPGGGKQ